MKTAIAYCRALELTGDPGQHTRNLGEDEKGVSIVDTLGGPQEMATITEPGLYKLIMRSRKPAAKAFTRWVTHEVLPQIRKTGSYALPAAPQLQGDLGARRTLDLLQTAAWGRVHDSPKLYSISALAARGRERH